MSESQTEYRANAVVTPIAPASGADYRYPLSRVQIEERGGVIATASTDSAVAVVVFDAADRLRIGHPLPDVPSVVRSMRDRSTPIGRFDLRRLLSVLQSLVGVWAQGEGTDDEDPPQLESYCDIAIAKNRNDIEALVITVPQHNKATVGACAAVMGIATKRDDPPLEWPAEFLGDRPKEAAQ